MKITPKTAGGHGQSPKILFYDLETGPNLGYVWGKWQQDVIRFKEEWELLSVAYKWAGGKVQAFGQDTFSEETVVIMLHHLLDEADIVIAHNGDQFDQKMANAKFIQFGLDPPSYYKTIDTKKVAKRYFRFNSNKLDDLGDLLKVGRKIQTGGFDTWLGCMAGDNKSWEKMLRYNKQDVVLLEKVYLKLRPWIDNHPGLNIIGSKPDSCPKCGKGPLQARGYRTTKVMRYQRYQCQNCGGWCTSRKGENLGVQYVN